MSTEPPGGEGQIRRIGRDGYCWAAAIEFIKRSPKAARTPLRNNETLIVMHLCPRGAWLGHHELQTVCFAHRRIRASVRMQSRGCKISVARAVERRQGN